MIRITTKIDGFRRAGITHVGTKDYPDGRFTPDQLAALQNDSMLRVEILPDAANGKNGKGKAEVSEAPPAPDPPHAENA